MIEESSIQPVKNPELNRVQEETDIVLKELSEIVDRLNSRLSKVMSSLPVPADLVKGSQDPKYYSKLAQEIDSYNECIRSVVFALRIILDKLEI